jgi:CheY-like chemotaxis protein
MGKKLEVLVADDEQSIRTLLAQIISEDLGHNATTAENGKDALDKALSKQYNIIITDYHMPDMDGVEFYAKLKESGEYTNLGKRTIVFTSDKENFKMDLFHMGIDYTELSYLPKPFECKELAEIIKEKARMFSQE